MPCGMANRERWPTKGSLNCDIIGFKLMSQEYSADLQDSIDEYRAKMEEIAENRSFLPLRYFDEAEGLIRSEILQSYEHKDSLPILQQALLSWRNELSSRNQGAIAKWCNELLAESTGAVDKKICREVKSFTTYRQEMLTTVDLLRKKTEPYLTCELSVLIQDALLGKIFEHVGQLHAAAISQMQDHLKVLEIEKKALTVECKEAKRRTNKEDNESQRIISELREKLGLADVRYSLLEQSNEDLRKELTSYQQAKQEAIHKLNQDFSLETSNLRAKVEEQSQQARQFKKRCTFLQMQLQKEQLLHKQTMLHYQELISSFHSKEEVLKEEILEASRVSEKEIDQFKILSTRRIEDWQQTANDLEEQLDQVQKDLKDRESENISLREALASLKESSRSVVDDLTKHVAQLEYRNKVLEQQEGESDQLRARVQRVEGELRKAQKDRDQLNEVCKENEKERLVAEQKLEHLSAEVAEERSRFVLLEEKLKQEKESLPPQRAKANQLIQTDDDLYKSKLKEALYLLQQIEGDCRKLQNSGMRTFA